jgi:hypothetical protein
MLVARPTAAGDLFETAKNSDANGFPRALLIRIGFNTVPLKTDASLF